MFCYDQQFKHKNQICSLVETPNAENIGSHQGWPAKQLLTTKSLINQTEKSLEVSLLLLNFRFSELKNFLEELQAKKSWTLMQWHGQDYLQFMNGLVLGQKSPQASFLADFTNAGLLHVLVASGFNVALVAGLAWTAAKKLSRKWQFSLILLAVWAYVIYLEFEPPLLRAAWMFSLVFGLKYGGVKTKRSRILAWTVVIILLFNPSLIDSLSLWLSALATLGIMTFSQRLFMFWHEQSGPTNGFISHFGGILLEEGRTSLAAQSLIFPLLAWYFHSVNIISFLANPILLPWLGGITQLSGLQFILSFLEKFWPVRIIGWLLAQGLNQFFSWYFTAVAWWQHFYFLNLTVSNHSSRLIIIGWAVVISLFFLITRTKQEVKNHFFHEKA